MLELKPVRSLLQRRRFPFRFVYSDSYWMVDLGNHVFPIKKYRLIYERLLAVGVRKDNFLVPEPVSGQDLRLVHSDRYIRKIREGKLSQAEMLALEIPYCRECVDFALLTVGGTILAAEEALESGLCIHIGGGFHHAFSGHGEGFCIFNDVAVALERMKRQDRIQRAMVVDCDVHQGNGTAEIFADKDYVFTFSLHQMDIYPAEKSFSNQDVGLWSGDGDEAYLSALQDSFPRLYEMFRPDLVFYLAGADPFKGDQLGGLDLSLEGLRKRDLVVIEHARKADLPLVIVLAGGYAFDIQDTVSIHMNTIDTARHVERRKTSFFRRVRFLPARTA
jgi:acetoin utilization deacetylase AcuC-like enzyme